MWALYTVPSVAKYPHSPPPPHHHHHPTPTHLPTLTNSTHTSVQHAWTHVCTFAHMQQGEWNAKWATWWKDTSTQTAFAYVGRGPFIQRDNVCVDFSLSAHFKHQKQQKEWGEEKKKEVRQACNHSHWHVQTYTSSPFISLLQFSIQQSCPGARLTRCVFDEDIFERLTSLSLTRHLSRTRGISLFGDDDDSRVILKVLMKLTSGGVGRECAFTK